MSPKILHFSNLADEFSFVSPFSFFFFFFFFKKNDFEMKNTMRKKKKTWCVKSCGFHSFFRCKCAKTGLKWKGAVLLEADGCGPSWICGVERKNTVTGESGRQVRLDDRWVWKTGETRGTRLEVRAAAALQPGRPLREKRRRRKDLINARRTWTTFTLSESKHKSLF